MNPAIDGIPKRRSNRLRNIDPEFTGLDSSGRTPERKVNVKGHDQMRFRNSSPSSSDDTEILKSTMNVTVLHSFKRTICSQNTNCETSPEINHKRLECVHVSSAYVSPSIKSDQCSYSKSVLKTGVILLLITLAAILMYNFRRVGNEDKNIDFHLHRLFPQQTNDIWGFVSHGITDNHPFVLLLLHDGEADLANCLAKHVAKEVAYSRTKLSAEPFIVDGRVENSNLLVNLRPEIEKQSAIVFHHVEHLRGDVAKNLHFILDVHEPWAFGGVYVLTLEVPNISFSAKETFGTVQTFLKNRWSGQMQDVELEPLITRICNFEYVIRKDKNPCK